MAGLDSRTQMIRDGNLALCTRSARLLRELSDGPGTSLPRERTGVALRTELHARYRHLWLKRDDRDVIIELLALVRNASYILATPLHWMLSCALEALTPIRILPRLSQSECLAIVLMHRLPWESEPFRMISCCVSSWQWIDLPNFVAAIESEILSGVDSYLVWLLNVLDDWLKGDPSIAQVPMHLGRGDKACRLWPGRTDYPQLIHQMTNSQPAQDPREVGYRVGLAICVRLNLLCQRLVDDDGRVTRSPTHSEASDATHMVHFLEDLGLACAEQHVRYAWQLDLVEFESRGESFVSWLVRFERPVLLTDEHVRNSSYTVTSIFLGGTPAHEVNRRLKAARAEHRQWVAQLCIDTEAEQQRLGAQLFDSLQAAHSVRCDKHHDAVLDLMDATAHLREDCAAPVETEPLGTVNIMPISGKLCSHCRHDLSDQPRKQCGRCLVALYCDKECQKKHWKSHKAYCNQERARLDSCLGEVD